MTNAKPLVSVIMPSYNARGFIRRAVDSALAQTGAPLEVIIVDDASSDATPEYLRETYAAEPRVRLIAQTVNRGPASARNLGIRQARGTWIGLLDADDAWRETRLASLLQYLNGPYDAVFDNLSGYDAAEGCETGLLFSRLPEQMTVETLLVPVLPGSRLNCGYMKPFMRRSFLVEHALAYDEGLRVSEDLLLYLLMLLEGARTRIVPEGNYLYTTPVGEKSRTHSAASHSVPDDARVCRALEGLAARYASRIPAETMQAIHARMAFMREEGPKALFYHAYARGQFWKMLVLARSEPGVRKDLRQKVSRRFPWAKSAR